MYKIVSGTKDYLAGECYNLHKLSDSLLKTYKRRGFKQIDTPILEKFELFSKRECGADIDNMFKLTDFDGSLLVMRSDMTMPIARVATTKIHDAYGMKFCYNAPSFKFSTRNSNELREFNQVGIEVFTEAKPYVDADIIILAIESLINAGLDEFQIEIGHVGYFKGLLNALNLDSYETEKLRNLVNSKNTFGLDFFIKNREPNVIWNAINSLPLQFGGTDTLLHLRDNTDNYEAKNALDNLIEIDKFIRLRGYGKYVSYDLSLVNGMSYYSGVVFKGITKYFGAAILAGGRYDGLSEAFGKKLPATGFAVGVNNLLTAVRRAGNRYSESPSVDIIVGGDLSRINEVEKIIAEELDKGLCVENAYCEDFVTLKIRAAAANARKLIFVSKNGKILSEILE